MIVLFFSINHFTVQLYLVTQYCQFVIKVTKYSQNVDIIMCINLINLPKTLSTFMLGRARISSSHAIY